MILLTNHVPNYCGFVLRCVRTYHHLQVVGRQAVPLKRGTQIRGILHKLLPLYVRIANVLCVSTGLCAYCFAGGSQDPSDKQPPDKLLSQSHDGAQGVIRSAPENTNSPHLNRKEANE